MIFRFKMLYSHKIFSITKYVPMFLASAFLATPVTMKPSFSLLPVFISPVFIILYRISQKLLLLLPFQNLTQDCHVLDFHLFLHIPFICDGFCRILSLEPNLSFLIPLVVEYESNVSSLLINIDAKVLVERILDVLPHNFTSQASKM